MRVSKLCLFLTIFLLTINQTQAQDWEPAGDKIKTEWGENLDPDNVWDAYPRPMMEREEWMNLTGFEVVWELSC